MKESSTYQMILEEGVEKGREEGARQVLLDFGTRRWGAPTPEILAWLESLHSVAEINDLVELVVETPGWHELRADHLNSR